jgi:hypothetical protein
MVKNFYWFSCKISVILERNLNFLDRFSENTQESILMKLLTVRAEFFDAEGTDGEI